MQSAKTRTSLLWQVWAREDRLHRKGRLAPWAWSCAAPKAQNVLVIERLAGKEGINDQTREHGHWNVPCGDFSCALGSEEMLRVGTGPRFAGELSPDCV